MQFPNAVAEVVCWDSTYTLLLSRDKHLTDSFNKYFAEAQNLEAFNR